MTPADRITSLMTSVPAIPGVTPTDFTTLTLDYRADWVSTLAMDDHEDMAGTLFFNPDWVHRASDHDIIYALAFHTVVRSLGITKNPTGVDERRYSMAVNFFVNEFLARNCVSPDATTPVLLDPAYRNLEVEAICADLETRYAA